MSNCNGANGDPTDLIAQALCQELFDKCPRLDLEEFAVQAAHNAKLDWDRLVKEWARERVDNTPCPPLEDFIGLYVNTAFDISIRVAKTLDQSAKPGTDTEPLSFNINSLPRQTAKLRHCRYDTWTFIPSSRNDAARKGMMNLLKLPRLLLSFVRNSEGKISHLEWDLQGGSCEGPAPDLADRVGPVKFHKLESEHTNALTAEMDPVTVF